MNNNDDSSSSSSEEDVAVVGVRRGGRYVQLRGDFMEDMSSDDDSVFDIDNNNINIINNNNNNNNDNNIIDLNNGSDSDSSSDDSLSSGVPVFAVPRRGYKRRAARRGNDEGARRRRGGDEQDSSDGDDDEGEEESSDGPGTTVGAGVTIRSILAGAQGETSEADEGVNNNAEVSEDKAFLHFGMDEERSYSDWTITVLPTSEARSNDPHEPGTDHDKEDVREQSYFVHRCVLAVGPRQSLYFRRAFDLPFREQHTSTSTIHLEPLAAKAFTKMLEYVYGAAQQSDLDIDTETAVPLRFLARYFEVPAMRSVVTQFIAKDLSPANCHIYYRHASIFQDDDMLQAVEALCKIKPLSICHKNPALLEVTNLDFWFRIVESWRGSALRRRASTMLSHLIRAFRDDFTADHFRDFTDKDRLPVVRGVELAKDLLRMEKELLVASGSQEGGAVGETDLQVRCIDAFARHQRSTKGNAESEKDLTSYLKAQHPLLLGPFLLKILEHERSHKRAAARPIQPPPPQQQQQQQQRQPPRPIVRTARYRAAAPRDAPRAPAPRRSLLWDEDLPIEVGQAPPAPRRSLLWHEDPPIEVGQAPPIQRQVLQPPRRYRYNFDPPEFDAPRVAQGRRQGPPPHPMNLPHPPPPAPAGLNRFARDPNLGFGPQRRAPHL